MEFIKVIWREHNLVFMYMVLFFIANIFLIDTIKRYKGTNNRNTKELDDFLLNKIDTSKRIGADVTINYIRKKFKGIRRNKKIYNSEVLFKGDYEKLILLEEKIMRDKNTYVKANTTMLKVNNEDTLKMYLKVAL